MKHEFDKCKRRFRQILGALPCAYIFGEVIVNGDGEPENYIVKDVNHAFTEITASSGGKYTGKRISGLFSHSSVKDDIAVFAEVAITGDPVEREFFSPRFGIHFRLFCFSPEEGSFIALLSDLSREKKLEDSVEFFTRFFSTTSDEFYILNSTGKFIAANETVALRMGISRHKIAGKHISDLNAMVGAEWWNTLWKSLVQRGSLQFETDHRTLDNEVYPVELSVDLMELNGARYACVVAKNISRKRSISKAIRQDRRFAEKAATMAGYFIWMIDSSGVFRPLLGGESDFISGLADDVFFSLIHEQDRDSFARAVKIEAEGSREFRMKTENGMTYHRSRWSMVENDCVVGICYPLCGAGLSGMGSESAVMDALSRMTGSLYGRLSRLKDAIEENNINTAGRMARSLTADLSILTGKTDFPEKTRFDVFLSENEGMLKQLFCNSIPLTVDSSQRVAGVVDPTSLENALVRLLLVIQHTDRATAVSVRSEGDAMSAGFSVTVSGRDGIQEELERLFIPLKNSMPGLASVYAMVRSGGGRINYQTHDHKIEFTMFFPRTGMNDASAAILIALPDAVDTARSYAALRSAGYSVAIENNSTEIVRRIREGGADVLVMSASMDDFSTEEIMSSVSGVTLIQVGGKPVQDGRKHLPDGFRTCDLVASITEIMTITEMPLVEDFQGGTLWGEPRLTPPLS